jgi:hypothetical protein
MPIGHTKGGTVVTGDSLDYFRLCVQKGAVGLELKGIKMTRGPVVWKRVAAEYGIKGNKQKVYDWLCAKVLELQKVQEHVVEEDGREKRLVEGKEVQ